MPLVAGRSSTTRSRNIVAALLRPGILDRYMVSELAGPFFFGLAAFSLIYAATTILAIGRLVSEEHAPLLAAIQYFLWQLPQIVVTVVPMAMLLGTLLALQRLSAESEITALKAGGIGLVRAVAPLLAVGVVVSLLTYALQETVVPYANDQALYLRDQAIQRLGAFGGATHTVVTPLPDSGQQVTYFRGYDPVSQQLLFVTIVTYGSDKRPQAVLFSDRGHYENDTWTFFNASIYHFNADGTTQFSGEPEMQVDVGEKPGQIRERFVDSNRESMSRSQIRDIIGSGQLSPEEVRAYQTTYEGKLARPFAAFVFTLIAIPFGLRPPRGGGGTGAGFALALGLAFVYFVLASASAGVASNVPGGYLASTIGAWLPNVIFIAIGYVLVRRAARY
jgi:lipopolysaccharide export system permease protein